ncbi:MAG: hypothetical protein HY815_13055 [Candidatus Riflebacteria bacterium]|nr:hypothetical protein [Candidatus Riflebacteria bacterium]
MALAFLILFDTSGVGPACARNKRSSTLSQERGRPLRASPREWHRELQFTFVDQVASGVATDLGLTINGLWADPDIAKERGAGRLAGGVAFMIAAWGDVIADAKDDGRDLVKAASKDIFGNKAVPDWYVEDHGMLDTLAMSINSPIFADFLKDKARWIVENADFLLVDEPMTHVGIMGLEKKNAGFGPDDIRVYEEHLRATRGRSFLEHLRVAHGFPGMTPDELLRFFDIRAVSEFDVATFLRKDPASAGGLSSALERSRGSVYREYEQFHQQNSYRKMSEYLDHARRHAKEKGSHAKIGANTPLGNTAEWCRLSAPLWDDRLDFTVSEMTPHDLEPIPKGKLMSSYKLAQALSGGRPFGLLSVACATALAKQFKTERKRFTTMNTVLFLEALANRGNYAFGWAAGPQAFIRAHGYTKPLIAFAKQHRGIYEWVQARHRIAVLYGNQAVMQDGRKFASYDGLAMGLAALGYQFDVIHSGDSVFNDLPVSDEKALAYEAILVPMANAFTASQVETLRKLGARGRKVVFFALGDRTLQGVGLDVHEDLGQRYVKSGDDAALQALRQALAPLEPEVTGTPRNVYATIDRAATADSAVVHLVNYNYRAADDSVVPQGPITLSIRTPGGFDDTWIAICLRPGVPPESLTFRVGGQRLEIRLPALDIYAALLLGRKEQVRRLLR